MGTSMEAFTEASMAAFILGFHYFHWILLHFHGSFQELALLPWKLLHAAKLTALSDGIFRGIDGSFRGSSRGSDGKLALLVEF